jgi:AcrR family transcriptional regulator
MSANTMDASPDGLRGRGGPLSRERIVTTALAIVDRHGLEALSMRKLATELGVYPTAIYYYIPTKSALLDAIVEAVMSGIDLTADDPSTTPEERIVRAACVYRDALLAHPNALPLSLSRGPNTPGGMRPVELVLSILRDAGVPPIEVIPAMNAIAAAVRGTVGMATDDSALARPAEVLAATDRFPEEEFPRLREALQWPKDYWGADFELGIRALVRGLLAGDS